MLEKKPSHSALEGLSPKCPITVWWLWEPSRMSHKFQAQTVQWALVTRMEASGFIMFTLLKAKQNVLCQYARYYSRTCGRDLSLMVGATGRLLLFWNKLSYSLLFNQSANLQPPKVWLIKRAAGFFSGTNHPCLSDCREYWPQDLPFAFPN